MDHHYVFPRDGGDVLAAEIEAAQQIGLRFHPTRGSMDLGQKDGGLPPDNVVEDTDDALAATEAAIDRWHDPSPDAMLQIAVAPCSPFSVTSKLMSEAAVLARRKGVRLHTHLAETDDEEDFCRERFGCTPVEYAEQLGWLGDDVWLAHGVHLDDSAIAKLGATGTGVAHCPSSNARLGAGSARVRELLDNAVPVGLGVDGAASQEASHLGGELRQALYTARLRRRTDVDVRPRGAAAGHHGRRAMPRPRSVTSGRWKWVSSATWSCGGSTGWVTTGSTTRSRRWSSARRRRWSWPWSAGSRWSSGARWSTRTPRR